ncbi:hypothetical protein PQR62_09730 [Herbaspirillum lusitanum]|uniref:Conjugal transfer protein n=1 Tax=Herbaspirillum lusitanum TaxID=213312 RepID=A0ABW9A6N0_9BURK
MNGFKRSAALALLPLLGLLSACGSSISLDKPWGIDRSPPPSAATAGAQQAARQESGAQVYAVPNPDQAGLAPATEPGAPIRNGATPPAPEVAASDVVPSVIAPSAQMPMTPPPAADDEPVTPTAIPVFSQLLFFQSPSTFHIGRESQGGDSFGRELLPAGETSDNWTRKLTVSALRNLALNPATTPENLAQSLIGQFNRSCPNAFAQMPLNEVVGNADGRYAVVGSCGTRAMMGGQGQVSETAMIAVLKGKRDYYVVQWAEHGQPMMPPINIPTGKWEDIYRKFGQIRLCDPVPGEGAPYRSCTDSK